MQCPLCSSADYITVKANTNRSFFKCNNCWLIFVNPDDYPKADNEKARYELHENSIEDAGYVSFLNKSITPALPYLTKEMKGLDYGCGPHPTLSQLLNKQGYKCDDYDPFFKPIELQPPYDFIFSTEAFEHFHHPKDELKKITELLTDDGLLVVMTDHWASLERFANWYYIADYTHVCFYHNETFKYIEKAYGYQQLYMDDKRVVILKKGL